MTNDERLRFTLRVPRRLLERINIEANKKGVSSNALILQILWEWIGNKDNLEDFSNS